jgi:FkbM family methyltransferase
MPTPHAKDTLIWIDAIKSVCNPLVYLDIGAGDGFDCGIVKNAFPDCRCLAIEPWEAWDLHPDVEPHRQVIGALNEHRCFYVKEIAGIHGLYSRETVATARVEALPVLTLEHFCEREGVVFVDAMKIDVEGAAWDVLIGAGKILDTVKAVHIETEWLFLFAGQHLEDHVFPFLLSAGLTKTWENRVDDLGQGDSIWVRL